VAYLPIPPIEMPANMASWEPTGFVWRNYYEYSLQGQSVMPVLHTLEKKDKLLSLAEDDPNSLACLVHPVGERKELDRSTMLAGSFHAYRYGSVVKKIFSDMPLSHVYEDLNCTRFQNGIKWPTMPGIRKYTQRNGVWRGEDCEDLPADLLHTILYTVRHLEVNWEFITPKNWKYVYEYFISRKAYEKSIYIPVFAPGTSVTLMDVPVSWSDLQVQEAVGSMVTRVTGGWCVAKRQEESWETSSGNVGASLWYHINGGLMSHFYFHHSEDQVTLKPKSKFAYGQTINSFNHPTHIFASINAVYDLDNDGPFMRGTDLKTCERSGRPRKKDLRRPKKKK